MKNKEKFLKLVTNEGSRSKKKNTVLMKSPDFISESQKIAIKILKSLDDLGCSQKILAERLDVSPQQITKIISGKENLTLSTIVKLQKALSIPLLASYLDLDLKRKAV